MDDVIKKISERLNGLTENEKLQFINECSIEIRSIFFKHRKTGKTGAAVMLQYAHFRGRVVGKQYEIAKAIFGTPFDPNPRPQHLLHIL